MHNLRRILIANRGEIVERIARTCHAMGIETVAVYSDADADAPFVSACDRGVRLGGTSSEQSYLDVVKIITAAQLCGADAIHPGFGFLSENPSLPRACAHAGLVFIGPSEEVIAQLGSKAVAKGLALAAGVPVIPGYHGDAQDDATLAREAQAIGFPVLIKASAGGGGKGMRVVRAESELSAALEAARRQASASFADPTLLIEKYIERPRHIEIQILADARGHVVHLGERECSIQRRHQKIVEESPSPAVDDELRQRMGEAAVALAKSVGYEGAGTVEFIVDDAGDFHFLEVNTRLQVEHPVTELVTGIDIVREQLRIAEGKPLSISETPRMLGHAIECRLYAEDPANDFLPQSGTLIECEIPDIDGLRVDGSLVSGMVISPHYDPMIAKLITWGDDRREAVRRMKRTLQQLSACGVVTNQAFLLRLMHHPDFEDGKLHTQFIEEHGQTLAAGPQPDTVATAAAAAALASRLQRFAGCEILPNLPRAFSNNSLGPERVRYQLGDGELLVVYREDRAGQMHVRVGDVEIGVRRYRYRPPFFDFETSEGLHQRIRVVLVEPFCFVSTDEGPLTLRTIPRFPEKLAEKVPGALTAPIPAKLVKLLVEEGQSVQAGAPIALLEAMKMEHQVQADSTGVVTSVAVSEGQQLEAGQLLVVIEPAST